MPNAEISKLDEVARRADNCLRRYLGSSDARKLDTRTFLELALAGAKSRGEEHVAGLLADDLGYVDALSDASRLHARAALKKDEAQPAADALAETGTEALAAELDAEALAAAESLAAREQAPDHEPLDPEDDVLPW